jgi:hypothetical protein
MNRNGPQCSKMWRPGYPFASDPTVWPLFQIKILLNLILLKYVSNLIVIETDITLAVERPFSVPGVDGHVKLSQKWSFGIEPLGE